MAKHNLYLLSICKGKTKFKIGDNIKNHLEDKSDFEYKKILDWSVNFSEEISSANLMIDQKKGHFDYLTGKWCPPKKSKELINQFWVIVTGQGIIRGIVEINRNDQEEEVK